MWIKTTKSSRYAGYPSAEGHLLLNSDVIKTISIGVWTFHADQNSPGLIQPYVRADSGYLYYPDTADTVATQLANCVKAINYIEHCLKRYATVGTSHTFICDLTGNLSTLDVPTVSHEIGTQSMFHPSADGGFPRDIHWRGTDLYGHVVQHRYRNR